jgi:glycosyltransferase involved in cell wall biosynthesis
MRVLLINKFYWRKAGAEAYLLDLEARLKDAGHEVAVFATDHPETLRTPWRKYFPRYRDFSRSEGWLKDAAKVKTMFWSAEAADRLAALLRDFEPEVAHLQNIYHHLSPSIISALGKKRVPIVETLHDYKFICPNYTLFTEGAACERCHVYRYWNAPAHRCVKNSRPASAAAAAEMWLHRLLQVYEKNIARFITPSAAMREIFVRWGKDPEKFVHLPNLLDLSRLPARVPDPGDGFLFAGRVEEWKGARFLLEAALKAPDLQFVFAGQGPLLAELRTRVAELSLRNIRFIGQVSREELYAEMLRARAVIVPSLGYDPYPTVALEAGALGKPVVASRIGGIPEIVEDGVTGLLFPAREEKALLDAIRALHYDPALAFRLGAAAERKIRRQADPETHLRKLLGIYQEVIAESRGSE